MRRQVLFFIGALVWLALVALLAGPVAMAGGNDYDRSEFNRVVQACRQPGSAYKPIYYSLALDRGYSFDTVWNDKVRTEVDPVTGEEWIPQNIDGSYGNVVNLERALVWSKNPPSATKSFWTSTTSSAAWAGKTFCSNVDNNSSESANTSASRQRSFGFRSCSIPFAAERIRQRSARTRWYRVAQLRAGL